MTTATVSQEFFEQKYQAADDPWQFATADYEQGRYDAIVAALAGRSYRRAFEPGCSIGVLTERLAPMCDHLVATDISSTAASRARQRCTGLQQVEVRCAALDAASVPADLDLVVMSEVGYYFDEQALMVLLRCVAERLEVGGLLLAAHWLGHSPDHILSGDRVHELLLQQPSLTLTHGERHEAEGHYAGFRLERLVRV